MQVNEKLRVPLALPVLRSVWRPAKFDFPVPSFWHNELPEYPVLGLPSVCLVS